MLVDQPVLFAFKFVVKRALICVDYFLYLGLLRKGRIASFQVRMSDTMTCVVDNKGENIFILLIEFIAESDQEALLEVFNIGVYP